MQLGQWVPRVPLVPSVPWASLEILETAEQLEAKGWREHQELPEAQELKGLRDLRARRALKVSWGLPETRELVAQLAPRVSLAKLAVQGLTGLKGPLELRDHREQQGLRDLPARMAIIPRDPKGRREPPH